MSEIPELQSSFEDFELPPMEKVSVEEEIQEYKAALKAVNRYASSAEKIVTLNELGNLYFKINDYDNALRAFFESLQITMEEEKDIWEAATRFYIGLVYMATDNLPAADFEFQQALDRFEAYEHPQTEIVRAKLNELRAMGK